jgi:hypothetical protein
MTPDIINGVIEFVGSLLTWMNVRRVIQDKGHAGIYVPAVAFFMTWGLWNLFYYPHLGQWWSFHGGLSLVAANISWIGSMLYYGRKS